MLNSFLSVFTSIKSEGRFMTTIFSCSLSNKKFYFITYFVKVLLSTADFVNRGPTVLLYGEQDFTSSGTNTGSSSLVKLVSCVLFVL